MTDPISTHASPDDPSIESPQSQETGGRRSLGHLIALAAILLFAASVRLYGLTAHSFWFDECATMEVVQSPWAGVIKKVIATENTPPAHYIFLKAWCDIFGVSEWSMRLPSAIAGVVSIWLLYRLCAYCVGKNEALIAAALMTVSHYHVWYSQEARVYIFMLTLALWSCDEFVRMLDEPPSWKRDLRYWIATLLLLYSHIYGVFAVAAQLVYYLGRMLSKQKPTLTFGRLGQLQLAVWIPFAMWGPVLRHWYQQRSGGFWIGAITGDDIPSSYLVYVCDQNRVVLLTIVALVVIGVARRDIRKSLPLLLSLMLLPTVVPVVASVLTNPLYLPRYGMIAMSGLFILAACGIARLPRLVQPAIVITLAIFMLRAPDPTVKGPFREVGAYLRQWMQPGEYIEVNSRADLAPVRYYTNRADVVYRAFWGFRVPLGLPLTKPNAHLWFVASFPYPPQNGVLTIRLGNWRVVSQRQFDDVLVFELADGVTTEADALPEDSRYNAEHTPTSDRSVSNLQTIR